MTTIDRATAITIVERGNAQITELTATIARLEDECQVKLRELDELRTHRATTEQDMQNARRTVNRLESEERMAVSYASLAQGTTVEQQAVKSAAEVKKSLKDARQALAKKEKAFAPQTLDEQEQVLQQALATLSGELDARRADLQGVHDGRSQAYGDLGEALLGEVLSRCQEKQQAIAAIRQQLVVAQVELHEEVEGGLQQLSAWPAHRGEITRIYPPDDATLRILRATIGYLTTMANDLGNIQTDFPTGNSVGLALNMPSMQMNTAGQIRDFAARIETIITDYRAHLVRQQERA